MKRFGFTVLKNATANVIRGGATAAVALVLPHFLTQALDADRFAAWSLMLQIAAYASYLDFGLQTAVARFLAQAIELEQHDRRNGLISTAFLMLSAAGAIALTIISVILWQSSHLFHGIPSALLPEFRSAAFLLAAASCISLPLSTYTGVLIGLHRNEYPAMAVGSSRLAGAVLAIVASRYTHSLIVLAVSIGLCNVIGGIVQIFAAKRLLPEMKFSLSFSQADVAVELLHFCLGLMVWSFGMFLVSGLDVTIVGHFQFAAVGYYAIASTLITFIAGLNGAVFSALMTPFAALHVKGNVKFIGEVVVDSTRLNTYINILIALVCTLGGYQILKLWVGATYAQQALPVLIVLAAAQAIRLVGSAYSIMLVATGQQNKGIVQGMVEAITNFGFSVWLAFRMGPIGVAWGTLIGATLGIVSILVYTMPQTWGSVPIARRQFVRRGILGPVCLAAPAALALLLMHSRNRIALLVVCLSGVIASILLAARAGYFSFKWRNVVST